MIPSPTQPPVMAMEIITAMSDVTPVPDERNITSPRPHHHHSSHTKGSGSGTSKISLANTEKNSATKTPKDADGYFLRDAIEDAMMETESLREASRVGYFPEEESINLPAWGRSNPSVRKVLVNLIRFSHWMKQNNIDRDLGCACMGDEEPVSVVIVPSSKNSVTSSTQEESKSESQVHTNGSTHSRKATLLQDLVWPLYACGVEAPPTTIKPNLAVEQNFQQMRQAMSKAVKGFTPGEDIWRFAAPASIDEEEEDDEESVATLDTLQEEANQIKRLGSWNTNYTGGTFGTFLTAGDATLLAHAMEDDDGHIIDPQLLKKLQAKAANGSSHTKKKKKRVKFDYPPIKSLRTCPRADPKDLPNLFFTEAEMEQIEDDRYSTMNTDDVEIVAVSQPNGKESRGDVAKSSKDVSSSERDAPAERRSATNRSPSPSSWRKRFTLSPRKHVQKQKEAEEATMSKQAGGEKRLVQGVQIYLRERSTIG